MVLGRAPKVYSMPEDYSSEEKTYVSKILKPNFGGLRGMTKSQWMDLNIDWVLYGDGEPLGFGHSKIAWYPGWTEKKGSDELLVPMLVHDIHGAPNRWGHPILPNKVADELYAEQTLRLIRWQQTNYQRDVWQFVRRIIQLKLIALRRLFG